MPVTSTHSDLEARTLTMVAEFAAPLERVWLVYSDPRQLEQVWGPEGYPATIVEHQLAPGGRMHYFMTSPEGEKYPGAWHVEEVETLRRFTFRDVFTDQDFTPVPDMPASHNEYRFETVPVGSLSDGTRATYTCTFETAEGLQQVLDMGVIEGSTSAINQIDELLARD